MKAVFDLDDLVVCDLDPLAVVAKLEDVGGVKPGDKCLDLGAGELMVLGRDLGLVDEEVEWFVRGHCRISLFVDERVTQEG